MASSEAVDPVDSVGAETVIGMAIGDVDEVPPPPAADAGMAIGVLSVEGLAVAPEDPLAVGRGIVIGADRAAGEDVAPDRAWGAGAVKGAAMATGEGEDPADGEALRTRLLNGARAKVVETYSLESVDETVADPVATPADERASLR